MKRVAVTSSNVAEVGYDPDTRTLEVAFVKGGVYHYLNVPSSVHQALLLAPSVGKYLDANVKKAGYTARKIAD